VISAQAARSTTLGAKLHPQRVAPHEVNAAATVGPTQNREPFSRGSSRPLGAACLKTVRSLAADARSPARGTPPGGELSRSHTQPRKGKMQTRRARAGDA
jgi:hypothetical protein